MENLTELETDIQNIKIFLDKCSQYYKKSLFEFSKADKILSVRKEFIVMQFKNVFTDYYRL